MGGNGANYRPGFNKAREDQAIYTPVSGPRPGTGAAATWILLHQSYCGEQTIHSGAKLKVRGRVWKNRVTIIKCPSFTLISVTPGLSAGPTVTNAQLCIQWPQNKCSMLPSQQPPATPAESPNNSRHCSQVEHWSLYHIYWWMCVKLHLCSEPVPTKQMGGGTL